MRVSNPRIVAYFHFRMSFENLNPPGAGPIFPDWTLRAGRTSEASRTRLGLFLESYTVGSFGTPFSGTCSFSRLGAGGSTRGGQYSQTPCQQYSRFLPNVPREAFGNQATPTQLSCSAPSSCTPSRVIGIICNTYPCPCPRHHAPCSYHAHAASTCVYV